MPMTARRRAWCLVFWGVSWSCAAADFTDDAAINTRGLDAGWTGAVITTAGDVALRSYRDGVPQFEFRIGAGGSLAAIVNLQAGPSTLLAPDSDPGVVTDSVIQSVWWDDGVHSTAPYPEDQTRYNMNQAGTSDNWFTPVNAVRVSSTPSPTVDVYSTPQDQWGLANRLSVASKTSFLTRYRLIGAGNLLIRRTMMPADPYVNGVRVPFRQLYIEAWLPFRAADTEPGFNALALDISPDGTPLWFYEENHNLPAYKPHPASTTYGYAIVFNEFARLAATAVGIVFGAKDPQSWTANKPTPFGLATLNTNDMKRVPGGVGALHVLPAIGFPADAPARAGAVIEQYLVLVPKTGMDAEMYSRVTAMAALVPAPRYFPPGSTFDGELADIVDTLRQNLVTTAGARTNHLAPLIR
jgi:hypothetical protein